MYEPGTEFFKEEPCLSAFLPFRELTGYRLVHDTMVIPRFFLAGSGRNGTGPPIMQICNRRNYIVKPAKPLFRGDCEI